MTYTPMLETARLTLRPHHVDDYAACRSLWADAQVVQHIGGVPQDAQAVWFRLLRYAGMWAMLGYGMWAIEDRASGAFLGEAGLLSAARGLPLELLPPAALPDDARVALSVSPRLPQGVATLRFHADDDLDALAYTFAQRHNLTRGAGCADSACVARRITVSMRAERDRARRAARLKFIHISKTAGSYIENIGHNINLQWD